MVRIHQRDHFMKDDLWKSAFEVRSKEHQDKNAYGGVGYTYDVVNLYNGEIVANYRDEKYANKQAKRRYKKAIRSLEKSFTSTIEVS